MRTQIIPTPYVMTREAWAVFTSQVLHQAPPPTRRDPFFLQWQVKVGPEERSVAKGSLSVLDLWAYFAIAMQATGYVVAASVFLVS